MQDLELCTMFEIEGVSSNIGVFDFLIGPAYQQLIIHICLYSQPCMNHSIRFHGRKVFKIS